jgi:hypothetical protein
MLKYVFQLTGTSGNYLFTELPDPMILSAIGTFVDSLGNPVVPYFFPYDADGNVQLYYVTVYSAGGVFQFAEQAVPYISDSGNSEISSAFVNELSNPQFAEILFPAGTTPYVYSFTSPSSQVAALAPGWDLVVSGSGASTVTVKQLTPVGTLIIPTNPGTILDINSAGLTSLILRQRLYGSPDLWASGFLSASLIAKTYSGTPTAITMNYADSTSPTVNIPIISGTIPEDGYYHVLTGTVEIPSSSNPGMFPSAYIDIDIVIPVGIEIAISSIMLVFTGTVPVDGIIYAQDSQERQIDQLYHYYNLPLQFKPIPSYLVGWDFPLNPAQLGTAFPTTAINSIYTWDQTIQFSTAASNLSVSRATTAGRGGYQISGATANTSGAIIQYIDLPTLYDILTNDLSVNVSALASVGIMATVSLWITANSSITGIAAGTSLVTALDAFGHPSTVVSGWVEVTRKFYPNNATFTIGTSVGNEFNDYGFTGWNVANNTSSAALIDTATFGAIVVGFAPITVGNSVTINSVSLVPGKIATRPAPQTFDEVLRECERYYEKSYADGIGVGASGTAGANNQLIAAQGATLAGSTVSMYAQYFNIIWKVPKRKPPVIAFYSPLSGVKNDITLNLWLGGLELMPVDVTAIKPDAAGGRWVLLTSDTKCATYVPADAGTLTTFSNSGAQTNPYGFILFHYTSNAQLGLV